MMRNSRPIRVLVDKELQGQILANADSSIRRTGETTRQMLEASRDALYIWCNDNLSYAKALAQHLGRGDLQIFGLSALNGDKLRGRVFTDIVVDHAAKLNLDQWECRERIWMNCRGPYDGEYEP